MDCTYYIAKTSCMITMQLICFFLFSHVQQDVAHFYITFGINVRHPQFLSVMFSFELVHDKQNIMCKKNQRGVQASRPNFSSGQYEKTQIRMYLIMSLNFQHLKYCCINLKGNINLQ